MESHGVEQHLLKELWFAKFIVKCPCALCWIVFAVLVVMAMIESQVHDFDVNKLFGSERAYYVLDDEHTIEYDAYQLASEFVEDANETNEVYEVQSDDQWMLTFYFTDKDYDDDMDSGSDYWILTPDNIELMISYEDQIMQSDDWKNRFCYVGEDGGSANNFSCASSSTSMPRTIYDLANFSSMTTDDIKLFVNDTLAYYYPFFNPDVDKYANGDYTKLQIYRVRSFFNAAGPFATSWNTSSAGITMHYSTYQEDYAPEDEDYTDETDGDWDEQTQDLEDWAKPMWEDITLNELGELTDGDLNIIFVDTENYALYFETTAYASFTFFGLAVLAVLAYMSFHLHSCFLGCGAMCQILLSFVLGFFWYRIVFWIDYTDFYSIMVIFILLGIGADDVFVFTDAWLQSIHFVDFDSAPKNEDAGCCQDRNEAGHIKRMSFTFRRAASAMLTTQATTFFAFLATAASSLMTLKAFGYWAAVVVASNYILVITLYPAILMIHDRWIKKYEDPLLPWTCCICCDRPCYDNTNKSAAPQPKPETGSPTDAPPVGLSRQLSVRDGVGDADEYRAIEKFLGRTWSKFVNKYKYFILPIFFVLAVVSVSLFVTGLEPDDDIFRNWKTGFWLSDLETLQGDFGVSDTDGLLPVQITYGIKGVNRDDVKTFDDEYYGDVVWDNNFEMWSTEAQEYLYTTCEEMRDSELVYEPPNSTFVQCPIMEWADYLTANNETFPYDAGSESAFAQKWSEFLDSDYSEETLGYKLSYVEEDSGTYTVRFYAMRCQLPVVFSDSSTIAIEYRDDYDDWISTNKENCPDNLCTYMGNSCFRWWILATEAAFISSALSGIVIALPLAFVVLLISTRNWIISIFAILDVLGVISGELCVMYIAGWKFGLTESIACIMVIGFSVDYVVHLGNSYLESNGESRMERLSFALLTMGVSVVSGAATTMLAGFMLIFPG